jgi:hypothetical protein
MEEVRLTVCNIVCLAMDDDPARFTTVVLRDFLASEFDTLLVIALAVHGCWDGNGKSVKRGGVWSGEEGREMGGKVERVMSRTAAVAALRRRWQREMSVMIELG